MRKTHRNRKAKRCALHKLRGTLSRAGSAGANAVPFSGRIGTRALSPGRYRAKVIATDAAGNKSSAKSIRFTIVRR